VKISHEKPTFPVLKGGTIYVLPDGRTFLLVWRRDDNGRMVYNLVDCNAGDLWYWSDEEWETEAQMVDHLKLLEAIARDDAVLVIPA
jgi:hypothetical protein